MIVLDASAVLEWVLATPWGLRVAARVAAEPELLNAPKLFDIEVLSGLRGLCLSKKLDVEDAEQALASLPELPIIRHDHGPLLQRAWELRESLSAYDALYVALAEALEATLLTCDTRLGRAHGHRAQIETFASNV